MNDELFSEHWKKSLQSRAGETPDFDAVWVAAEARWLDERRRFRQISAVVAIVAILTVAVLYPGGRQMQSVAVGEDFLGSTLWTAPSDVLIPRHDFDIYQDVPALMVPGELEEGNLL